MTPRPRLDAALDKAAPAIVAAAILGAAAGSSIQRDIYDVGRPARWALLGLLFGFAVVRAAVMWREWRFPRWAAVALSAFCGLALVSTKWSVAPRGTLDRVLGASAVITAIGLLAGCMASRPSLASRLLDGVLVAAAVVSVAGFVYWLVAPHGAAIPATTEYPSRYQGIEQNPNTPPLLLAIALPLAFVRALRAQDHRRRGVYLVFVLVLAASITASGSRGGLLAAFVGLLTVAVLLPETRARRSVLALLVVAGLVVATWATTIPHALPSSAASAPAASFTKDAEKTLPLSQELGNPWWTHRAGGSQRSLFNTSVRVRAWRGTVRRALERAVLGYGFGAEQWAFVNRYYAYAAENPENGYLGVFLQLGFVGVALFLVAVGLCIVSAVRAALRGWGDDVLVAAVGAAAAALALALSQSFFHGPGNIVYVPLWIALLTTCAVAAPRRQP